MEADTTDKYIQPLYLSNHHLVTVLQDHNDGDKHSYHNTTLTVSKQKRVNTTIQIIIVVVAHSSLNSSPIDIWFYKLFGNRHLYLFQRY